MAALFKRLIVVTKKTALEELLERFVTVDQARFYIEHMGLSFDDYEASHQAETEALQRLLSILPSDPRNMRIDRSFLPSFTFDPRDLVLTLGSNGLVANAAKYAGGVPLLPVNADPTRHDSVLLPFDVDTLVARLPAVLRGECPEKIVTLAEARLNDGQRLLAFNDLFIGRKDHVSARYRIHFADGAENQSSSGMIVSTGAGSTAWLRSVLTGALSIAQTLNATRVQQKTPSTRFDWAADFLRFAVREPFPSPRTGTSIVYGTVDARRPLRIESQMPEGGVIFSDGVAEDAIAFNSGAVAEIGVAPVKARLLWN